MNEDLRDHFLGWQCRIRQIAVREFGGRPLEGMRPRATRLDGREIAPAVTTVLVEAEPAQSTALFRHIARKTQDPGVRYNEALRVLSAAHYQHPGNFSDALTALFGLDSLVAKALLELKRCALVFEQFGQRYRLPCETVELARGDPAYEATYWHNFLFNPALPAAVRILAFEPDWAQAEASPEPCAGAEARSGL